VGQHPPVASAQAFDSAGRLTRQQVVVAPLANIGATLTA
jgi:hypothetical protein